MSPLRHPDEEPADPLVGREEENPEVVEVSTVLRWLAAAVAAVVVGSVIVFSPGSNPPTTTTPAVPSVPTTVPVLGETRPRTGKATLDWRRAEGLEEVDWVNAVTAHDGDYYLAGQDEDFDSTIHVSGEGFAWRPFTAVPHPEGKEARVTHLVSADEGLVAVGAVGDADGATERVATWWADDDGSWRYRPLPEPEASALAEDPRMPGDLATQVSVQGAAALEGEGVVVVGAREYTVANAGSGVPETPEAWQELLDSGRASLIQTGTEVRLQVHPFVVDTIELDSDAVPDPGIPFPDRSLTWLAGPESDPSRPPAEDLPHPVGVLEDGAMYGRDRSGRLYTSDDGLTWDRVGVSGDGSEAVPFAEGWVRSWERGLSYSTDGRDWARSRPTTFPTR